MPDELVQTFTWQNDHYKAAVLEDGMVQVGAATLGKIVLFAEKGDTYSDELGDVIGVCRPVDGIVIEQRSDRHCVLRILYAVFWGDIQISATVRLIFDPSPMIRWQIELDSRGTDFRLDVIFETARPGNIYAGMPFDIIPRRAADTDLLPRELSPGNLTTNWQGYC
jgi:alpha-mannosidase